MTNTTNTMLRTMATQLTAECRATIRIQGRSDVNHLGFALVLGTMTRPCLAALVFAG